ncbi:MAG: PilW family protein [Pseudomonadota bacterium]
MRLVPGFLSRFKRASGFSLIELMIAIALGVSLSFVVCHLLLQSKRSYIVAQMQARLEDNGRYALRYLGHELRMAGHLADLNSRTSVQANETGSPCFNYLLRTEVPFAHSNDVDKDGQPHGAGPGFPNDCLLPGQHQTGSDVLVVRRTASQPSLLDGVRLASVDSDDLFIGRAGRYQLPMLERGRNVEKTGTSWLYQPQVLFVRNYSAIKGDKIPTLCRKRPGRSSNRMTPTECLIEGIEMLHLEFGLDDTDDRQVDRYVAQVTVDDLRSAVAARLYLLVRSVREMAGHTDSRRYVLGSRIVTASGDGYVRRLMRTTVLLRNNVVSPL